MDSFDDFEFKPLTEGLGFHKKNSQATQSQSDKKLPPLEPKSKLSSALDNLNLNSNALNFDKPQFNDLRAEPTRNFESKVALPELTPDTNIFSKTLPRNERDVPATVIPKFNSRFNKPLVAQSIPQVTGFLDTKNETTAPVVPNKIDTRVEVNFIEVAPSALSLFLDFTVIAGLSILFTLGLVVATSLDISPILGNAGNDVGTQLGIALLIYSVSQLYLVLSRSFFGQTLGEWSMDTQLGREEDQATLAYIFKLIARTSVLALTGFITLPMISMFLGIDISGRITGLKLYRK